jgi:hypothetical protein
VTEQPHLGELLSAHLDGELSADEAATVEAHLADCDACRAELDATRVVREKVRAAPAVDPPVGFYERLVRTRRWSRTQAAASVVAIAAAWILVLGFVVDPGRSTVKPPVDETRVLLSRSDVADSFVVQPAGLHRVDPNATPLPKSVLELPRSSAFEVNGGLLVVFGSHVAVFIRQADVDWSTLHGGLRKPVAGVNGTPWESTDTNVTPALVYQGGDWTVMVLGPEGTDLEQAAREIGDPATQSFIDRVRDACGSVMDGFSLR